jgi:hypothetical protein
MDGTQKKASKDAPEAIAATQVVTAYRLTDGVVIWLTRDNAWSEWVEEAAVAGSATETERLTAEAKAWEARNQVYEVYPVDVTVRDGKPWPVKMREVMRAQGPSIHPQFGMQAERGMQLKATAYAAAKKTERGERKENREG